MKRSLIVAMDQNRIIGSKNDLPWRLPEDLKRVKRVTNGHAIVMGRKNYESIGKPLTGRRNIVMTRDRTLAIEGCLMAYSIQDVFDLCQGEEEVFIFGGEKIYELFLPYVEKMYITSIDHAFKGDTYFPEVNMDEWREISNEKGVKNEKNPYNYSFYVYEKEL